MLIVWTDSLINQNNQYFNLSRQQRIVQGMSIDAEGVNADKPDASLKARQAKKRESSEARGRGGTSDSIRRGNLQYSLE